MRSNEYDRMVDIYRIDQFSDYDFLRSAIYLAKKSQEDYRKVQLLKAHYKKRRSYVNYDRLFLSF